MSRRSFFAAALALSAVSAVGAQTGRAARFMENCQRNRNDYAQFCETREFTMPAARALAIDGRQNGGIAVHGWDRPDVHVVALVQAQAESDAEATAIARQVVVSANNGEVGAAGPSWNGLGRHESWSVSYEVWAPRASDLTLRANNGGIEADGLSGHLDMETMNGGLTLTDISGEVRGATTNGGITAELTGDRWRGSGLDLSTTNGGVRITIPSNYSAMLETGTVNGSLNVDFPVTIQGSVGRRMTTQLGGGGPTIRAVTTNGGVTIRRR